VTIQRARLNGGGSCPRFAVAVAHGRCPRRYRCGLRRYPW
jgi:hypothetical protein